MKIFPSLISSDLLNLEKSIKILEPESDGFHIDVMDDHFVPNLTWGPAFVNAIASIAQKPLLVHLMVDNPKKWLDRLNLEPKDIFVFHCEAIEQPFIPEFIDVIRDRNIKAGIAVSPKTSINNIFDYLPKLDHVLLMSVEPGFSGQKFMPEVLDKVVPLVELREKQGFTFELSMDGGIGKENIQKLAALGVDQVGIANAIFSQTDWIKAIKELK